MKLSKLRVIILGIVALGVLGIGGVFAFKAPLKAFVNGIRAERIHAKAIEAFEAERWEQASRLGTAAHHLDNGNAEIDLLVARSFLKQRNAAAISWWLLVLDEPGLPVDELRELTAALLVGQDLEVAMPFLSRLVELDGDNPETHRLWLQSLQIQHRYGRVRTLASEFAKSGSEDWSIHRAYMYMQKNIDRDGGDDAIISHLLELIEEDGPLALNAARELIVFRGLDPEPLALTAAYLESNAQTNMDRLFATSAAVRAGQRSRGDLDSVLEDILAEPADDDFLKLVVWAKWMGEADWFLSRLDWETFRDNGGTADAFLDLLYTERRFGELLQLTESAASEGGEGMAVFLYYRSVALLESGDPEGAQETLDLAVQTVDPASYASLERYLSRDQRWELLSRLYDIILRNSPGESIFLGKALGARYYAGLQDELKPILEQIHLEEYSKQPNIQGFLLYARLLDEGFTAQTHKEIETLMADFPEIFDFRLVLGVSYVLQGRRALGEDLLTGMPPLGLDAPRYLRVAAVILGLPEDDLLLLGERELLLPKELYLLSLAGK